MTNRAATLALGIVSCMVAGASIMATCARDARAADECLAAPNKTSPLGEHWYYRIERSTKRHCWYLSAKREVASRTAKSMPSRRAALFATLRGENPHADPAVDAHAELVPGRAGETLRAEDTLITPPTGRNGSAARQDIKQDPFDRVSSEDPRSLIGARWPDARTSAGEQASFAMASATPMANLGVNLGMTAAVPGTSPAAMSRAQAPIAKHASSLYALLWAFCGAVALVAVAGSATYVVTQERALDGWRRGSFDVARLTSRLDPTASVSTRLRSHARHARKWDS